MKITYKDKVALTDDETIPSENKVTAEDMNEIKKAVNLNDEKIQQNTENIEQLKSKNTEQDRTIQDNAESIEELQKENTELIEENERLRNDINKVIPSISGEGENVTLKDTAEARFKKLQIGGNSWQETRSGRNKLNKADGVISGFVYVDITNIVEVNKEFYFSVEVSELVGDCMLRIDYIKDGVKNYKFGNTIVDATSGKLYIRTTLEAIDENTNVEIVIKDAKISLTSAKYSNWYLTYTDDTTYEIYGAMPSTDYPSDIRNCGDNVNYKITNLNELKSFKEGETTYFIYGVTNTKISDTEYWKAVPLKDNWIHVECNNTTSATNDRYINTFIAPDKISNLKPNTTYTIVIEFRNVNIETMKQDLNIGRTNGNVDNYFKSLLSYNASKIANNKVYKEILTTVNEMSGAVALRNYQVVRPNDKFSYDYRMSVIEGDYRNVDYTYQEHQEQNFTFPLAEGQRLMLGDYLADDGIHHVKGQIIFDGTNYSFSMTERNDGNKAFWISNTNIPNAKLSSNVKMSNYFKYEYISWQKASVPSMSENNIGDVDPMFLFNVPTDFASSVSEWNNRLIEWNNAGNPLVVEYELAEEEIDPYTEEQQAVYNEIKKTAHSYGDTTHIFCTDETSLIFNVEAKADIQAMFNNLQAQILAGEV